MLAEYRVITLKLSEFHTIHKNFVGRAAHRKPAQAVRETLDIYCESNPLPDILAAVAKIETSIYHDLFFQLYRVIVRADSAKRRAVWFHGAPNAGKSCVSAMLASIFHCQDLVCTEGKYTLTTTERPFATQVAVLDESNFYDMFKASNVANMKRFLEGRGYIVRTMYSQPTTDMVGACVFITSNGLPALSKDEEHPYDWMAIQVRTAFVETTHSFPDRGAQAFPISAPELAHYLQHMQSKYEAQEPPSSMKPLELMQAPLIGKRRAQAPAIDQPAKRAKTHHDLEWGVQAPLHFMPHSQ